MNNIFNKLKSNTIKKKNNTIFYNNNTMQKYKNFNKLNKITRIIYKHF